MSHLNKLTLSRFVDKAKMVHGDRYDYSKVEYVNNKTKVYIICPIHGGFLQTPQNHLSGSGCPKCNKYKVGTTKSFIEKAKAVHGDKYDYGEVVYEKSNKKVCIICPKHGKFWQTPNSHLHGSGCPKCANEDKIGRNAFTKDTFVNKAIEIHGDKYDYSKVNYVNSNTKVCIVCPEHGEFWQTPSKHLSGQGCRQCGIRLRSLNQMFTTNSFIEKAKSIHGDKYIYDKTTYVGYDIPVLIQCKEHGYFYQTPDSHLQGSGCQKCSHKESQTENELSKIIKELSPNSIVETRVRNIISSQQEIDILIRDKNVAFEYNGIRWHSERFGKTKNYHLNKTEKCAKKGIKLYHIFEDEFILHRDIVIDKIKEILGVNYNKKRIGGRQCVVKIIRNNVAKKFLNANHLQGYTNSTVHIGCFYNEELVGVMSFRREIKDKDNWELTRFATDINYNCPGVGGKLFKHFIKQYSPNTVKSFADRRWTNDCNCNLYIKLGFKLDKILKPDYRYVSNKTGVNRIHKFNMRKQLLLKRFPNEGLNEGMTEHEMTEKLGFFKIWDCGLFKYEWRNGEN